MKWKLVRSANGEPEIREREDEPAPRRSLLEELAQDPTSGLVKIGPGAWMASKLSH